MPPEADERQHDDTHPPAPTPQVSSDDTSHASPTLDAPHRRALDAVTKLCENLPGMAEATCEAVNLPADPDPTPTLKQRDVAVTVTAGSVTALNDALTAMHRRATGEFPQSVGSAVAMDTGPAREAGGRWSRRDLFGVIVKSTN